MKQALVTLYLILFSTLLNAQYVRIISDEFGQKGEIRTSLPYADSLPREGRFELRWRSVDSTAIHTFHSAGNTHQHVPHGKWLWEEASWQYAIVTGNSIRPAFETKGVRTQWNANFQHGVPHGKWIITQDSIDENGKSGLTIFHLEINYSHGIPTGHIVMEQKIQGNYFLLKGTMNKFGMAHGNWRFDYGSDLNHLEKEIRTYQNGLLLEVHTFQGTQVSIKPFTANQAYAQGSPINQSQIGSLQFDQDEWGQYAGNVSTKLINQFIGKGWTHEAFPFQFVLKKPGYSQLEFPLSAEELELKQVLQEKITRIRQELSRRLEENMLIHRTRGESFDLAVSYLEKTAQRCALVDSLLTWTESPLFTYKNRHERGLLNWCATIDGDLEVIGLIYPNDTAHLPEMGKVTDGSTIFHLIKSLLERTETEMQPYLAHLDEARSALQREGELQFLQEKLIVKYEKLIQSYSNTTGTAELIYKKWVSGESKQLLQDFARTDQFEDAQILGETLLERMEMLLNWRNQTERVDSMLSLLQAQYRYLAYNPYTGINDIEVKLKRRFMQVIQTTYWPWVENQLIHSDNWDELKQNWDVTFDSFNFLMNFARREDKAAERLEKRIKKEKKPERMWKLIQTAMEEMEKSANQ